MAFSLNRARKIVVVGFAGAQSIDLVGPSEVFCMANRFAGTVLYEVKLASSAGGEIVCNSGLRLGPVARLQRLSGDLDTVLIAGGDPDAVRRARRSAVVSWILSRRNSIRRIGSVCSGTLVLAATGLLGSRRAATHWAFHDEFRALHPEVVLEPDAIFVIDPPYYTSAGVTAGIDLALSMLESDHGCELAEQVARNLVLFMRRAGGQAQVSSASNVKRLAPRRVVSLIAEISRNPSRGFRLPEMASLCGMSDRNFSRVFRRETGLTPMAFVEQARLDRAKSILESTDWTIARVSQLAGFGTFHGLHRAFRKYLGTTPGDYRARFGVPVSPRTGVRPPRHVRGFGG